MIINAPFFRLKLLISRLHMGAKSTFYNKKVVFVTVVYVYLKISRCWARYWLEFLSKILLIAR